MIRSHSAELLASPPQPIDYLVDGLLPVGTLGDISGPPGDGKSTIALHLAAHISAGASWFGKRTRATPVAWITGEASGIQALQRDLHRLSLGVDTDITFLLPETELFRFDDGRWLVTSEGAAALNEVHELGIGLVVIDTIGSVCAGLNELNNDETRQLGRFLRGVLGTLTGLTLSHTNQASARDQLAWRLHYLSRAGGNGFPGFIRWAAGVSKLQPDDAPFPGRRISKDDIEQNKLVAFGVSKHNEMPRPPDCNNDRPMIFQIDPAGGLRLLPNGEVVALYPQATGIAKARARASAREANGRWGDEQDF